MLFSQLAGLGLIIVGSLAVSALKGDSSESANHTTSGFSGFGSTSSSSSEPDHYKDTLDYCYNLSSDELKTYVESNYDLRKYGSHIDLDRDKYHVCSDIAELASKLGRSFDDRYDRW